MRWSLSGEPNGSIPKMGFLALNCALLALIAWAATTRLPKDMKVSDAGPPFVMGLGGMLIPSGAFVCAALNLDRASWTQAAPLSGCASLMLLLPSALALVTGFGVRALRKGTASGGDDGPGTTDAAAVSPVAAESDLIVVDLQE
jgi:hypothetical protein